MGEERQGAANTPPGRKLSVSAAALELGISAEAVRSRIKRGTLRSVKEGSTVYVLLDADQARPDKDQTPPGHDQTSDRAGESSALISHLQDEISYLREENRRKDEIIMQQAVTMRALTAPSESPVSSSEASEGARSPDAGDEEHAATERPHAEEEPRSWWRRFFGFD